MFQTLEVLRGQKDIPRKIRKLCHMSPQLKPVADAKDFSELDVVLVEPSSPTELTFRGIFINRLRVAIEILNPIKELGGKEAVKLSAAWLRNGLVGLDEAVRAETSAKLLTYVHGDTEEAELARAVIQETRASRSDILGGFRKIREMFRCPIGAVSYVFRYMPDGRVVSWPAGFREEVLAAAQQSNLPIFDPVPMVREYGIEAALSSDSGHYSAKFLPVAAKALSGFGRSVYEGRLAA
jgi:hypothetical protein